MSQALAVRARARVLTPESAARFEQELLSDLAHSVTTAAEAVDLNPNTVRDAINRYRRGEFESDQHAEVCRLFAVAKAKHIKELRSKGFDAARTANGPGVSWFKWQLEVQDPVEHPRKSEVEVSGPDGGPIQHAVLVLPANGREPGDGGEGG